MITTYTNLVLSTAFLKKQLKSIDLCMWLFCLHVCLFTMHALFPWWSEEDISGLELQIVVNFHVGAGNQAWVLRGAASEWS